MKTLLTIAVLAFMTTSASAGWIERTNRSLNTPVAKEQLMKRVCNDTTPSSFNTCETFKKNGVPDSDVRIAIVGTAIVLGGAGGAALATVPVGAAGAKTVLGTWGVTSIAGNAVTAASAGAAGALIGGVVGTGVALTQ